MDWDSSCIATLFMSSNLSMRLEEVTPSADTRYFQRGWSCSSALLCQCCE